MEVSDYTYDPRIRRRHIPLLTQQKRLRHLTAIFARNIVLVDFTGKDNFRLFYTIHLDKESEPIYTSEISEGNLNPTWQQLGSSRFQHSANHASSSFFIVRVWMLKDSVFSATCIIEWAVHLGGLRYLGEQVPKDGRKFLPNSLLFAMPEGVYGAPDCMLQGAKGDTQGNTLHEVLYSDPTVVRSSCTVNSLRRLLTTERAIKQTQASVQRVRRAIEQRLRERVRLQKVQAEREQLQLTVQMLEEKRDESAALRNKERAFLDREQDGLHQKQEELRKKAEDLLHQRDSLVTQREHYIASRKQLLTTRGLLKKRRRELITDLLFIFPIVPCPDKKGYSICSVLLPHSEDFVGQNDMMLSVSLGYVTKVVLMISLFLDVPLHYPLLYFGTYSSVRDNLSDAIPDADRTLALYPRSKQKKFFHYAVFLLNKDITQLRWHCDMRTPDMRLTLYNLYTLVTSYSDDDISSSQPVSSHNPSPLLQNHMVTPDNRSSDDASSTQLQLSVESSMSGTDQHPLLASLLQQTRHEANGTMPTFLLSSSLDKGLNHLHETQESSTHQLLPAPQLLRHQGSQHSSEPNLRALEKKCRSQTINLPVVMQPVVYPVEDNGGAQGTGDESIEIGVDILFDAELTARTEVLANDRRSFRTYSCTSSTRT
ncbi:UV radiation resistance-associated protein-like isoform X2 [Ornithodoros turicata]|uniref:UV radiation resistance-associated protein-like isoform X2 n=1 Tax=Ornithodoros turicata TaxID=34597 RepID=UPI003138F9E7